MAVKKSTTMEKLLPADFFKKIAAGEYRTDYYPKFADRKAWKKVRKCEVADRLIALADAATETPVQQLPYSAYKEFQINGDRAKYETLFFGRGNELSVLALAICLTGDKEKYMPHLMDRLIAILEEFTWCIPAHMDWDPESGAPKKPYPSDLFCCATGAMLAEVVKILGEELEKEWRGITDWIAKQALERVVYNVLENEEVRWHWWYNGSGTNNWTIWCGYNCMATAVQFEKDPKKLAMILRKFYNTASLFADSYSKDGYCDEGAGYYTRAGAMLFRAVDLMDKLRPGSAAKTYQDPKIRAIFEFIARIRLGKNYVVSFSDGGCKLPTMLSCIVPAGAMIGSKAMLEFGVDRPAYLGSCGDMITESLALLFDYPAKQVPEKESAGVPCTCYKDRLGILRSEHFTATLKGGHNAENHNHNDLGHFEVFYDGEPVVVDAGTGRYAKINFSAQRYTLWYTRGNGHNAPVIGGMEQQSGRNYTATLDVMEDRKGLKSDLSNAYPAEAGVKAFTRELNFAPDQLVVEDTLKLKKKQPVSINLIVFGKPVIRKDGSVKMGKVKLTPEGLKAESVACVDKLYPGANPVWDEKLYELKLTGSEKHYKLIFTKG